MVDDISIMISAVVMAVGFMMVFAASISNFVERHPTFKMLALSFILLIGFTLFAEGWEDISLVEPVKLHEPYVRGSKDTQR